MPVVNLAALALGAATLAPSIAQPQYPTAVQLQGSRLVADTVLIEAVSHHGRIIAPSYPGPGPEPVSRAAVR
jgi:hypothetical protein